jgi:hypothetical protein
MDAAMQQVVTPELDEGRLAQMRAHLLDEIDRAESKREGRRGARSWANAHRRRLLAVVAAALAVTYVVPALAQERWWWVTSSGDPWRPVSQVITLGRWEVQDLLVDPSRTRVPTAHLVAAREHWIVQAYLSTGGQLCLGISPDPPLPANEGAGIGCGFPVRGMNGSTTPDAKEHWVGYIAGVPGKVTATSPKFMFGPAASTVRTVDLANSNDRTVIRVPTHALPSSLGVDGRFWIVVIRPDQLVHMIVPRDEKGDALEHWRLPIAQ